MKFHLRLPLLFLLATWKTIAAAKTRSNHGKSSGVHEATPPSQNIHRIAICSVGHARTFYRPNLPHALIKNLINVVPHGGVADFFFFGHLESGNQTFGLFEQKEKLFKTQAEEREAIEKSLSIPGLRTKYTEIHYGSTVEELVRSFKKDNLALLDGGSSHRKSIKLLAMRQDQGQSLGSLAASMQFFWMYRCLAKVKQVSEKDGKSYDLIVRTRPDILLFDQLPWSMLKMSKLNYMPRWEMTDPKTKNENIGGEDWFFVAAPSVLSDYMAPLVTKYLNVEGPSLDMDGMFPYERNTAAWAEEARKNLSEVLLPATMVRGTGTVECERVPSLGRALHFPELDKAYGERCRSFRSPIDGTLKLYDENRFP